MNEAAALDDALAGLIAEGRTGIALRAPAGGLQFVGCCVETLREAARRPPFERMALLVASQVAAGRVRVARAFGDPIQLSNSAPSRDPGEGFTGSSFRINIAARLGIPRIPGPIAVWLIARDLVAGPVHFLVEDRLPSGIEDKEVTKFLAAWRKRNAVKPRGADAATVWPEETVFGSYPVYRKTAETPSMPNHGIALSAKPEIVLERDAVWMLAGSFRLSVPLRHVVLQPRSGDPTTAVIPITLVITSNDLAGPLVLRLRVPSYSSVSPGSPGSIAQGQFKLNLFSFSGMWRVRQRYFIYAVYGDTISKPAVTALVAKGGM